MSARDYALDYSAPDRGWATQGATDYCDSNGHATHRVDGVDTGICPRCLTVTERYNGNGDRISHGYTPEGEVFGIEVTDTPAAEFEDQGYSEWIDLIESQVYVNAEARVHRDFSSQSGVQGFVGASKGQTNTEPNGTRMFYVNEDTKMFTDHDWIKEAWEEYGFKLTESVDRPGPGYQWA